MGQLYNSIVFVEEHRQMVNEVECLIAISANRLVKNSRAAFTDDEVKDIDRLLEAGNYEFLFKFLRSRAAEITKHDQPRIYWDWIDAYGFYADATGTQWKYMSNERRRNSLMWAEEHALKVCNA